GFPRIKNGSLDSLPRSGKGFFQPFPACRDSGGHGFPDLLTKLGLGEEPSQRAHNERDSANPRVDEADNGAKQLADVHQYRTHLPERLKHRSDNPAKLRQNRVSRFSHTHDIEQTLTNGSTLKRASNTLNRAAQSAQRRSRSTNRLRNSFKPLKA